MRTRTTLFAATLAAALSAAPSFAQDVKQSPAARDSEWISLNGRVAAVAPESFTLRYGGTDINVRMDDHDRYTENVLDAGDRVVVTGRIDDGVYENSTVEASTVFVEKLREYFYAGSPDDEDDYYRANPVGNYGSGDDWVRVTGRVMRTEGDEMMLDTGVGTMTVDTGAIDDRPPLDPGVRVAVFGLTNDADTFEERELLASDVAILSR